MSISNTAANTTNGMNVAQSYCLLQVACSLSDATWCCLRACWLHWSFLARVWVHCMGVAILVQPPSSTAKLMHSVPIWRDITRAQNGPIFYINECLDSGAPSCSKVWIPWQIPWQNTWGLEKQGYEKYSTKIKFLHKLSTLKSMCTHNSSQKSN